MPKNQNQNLSPSQTKTLKRKRIALAVAALALLAVPVVYFGALFDAGHPSAMCAACHEMRAPYHKWASSQHKDIACDQCHEAPGMGKMVMSKLKNRKSGKIESAHVSQKKCLDCHKGKTEQRMIVLRGIKLNHETHFNKEVSCLSCHSGTGHSADPAPAMLAESGGSFNCRSCHNDLHGGGLSDCSACHVPQDLSLASYDAGAFKRAGITQPHHRDAKDKNQNCNKCHSQQDCYGCHVTQSPHKQGFDHVKESKNDGRFCIQCHGFDFCSQCHNIKKQHAADPEWARTGHSQFQEQIATCEGAGCHSQTDKELRPCDKCHEKTSKPFLLKSEKTYHNKNFVNTHPLYASTEKDVAADCANCHTSSYCISCHQGQKLHPREWNLGHAKRLKAISGKKGRPKTAEDKCVSCHQTNFCAECHKQKAPGGVVAPSHPADFKVKEKGHDLLPESKTALCNNCHSPGSCSTSDCHKEFKKLPHDRQFNLGEHKDDSLKFGAECAKCHDADFCSNCHMTTRPESHKEKEWYLTHKNPEDPKSNYCTLCHAEEPFCATCHTSEDKVTHKKDTWEKEHEEVTARKELNNCANCHRLDSPSCSNPGTDCHSQKAIQGRHEEENHKSCSSCHINFEWKLAGASVCADCHKDKARQSKPSKHTNCNDCHTPLHENGKEACAECHKKEADAAAREKKHLEEPYTYCSACHAPWVGQDDEKVKPHNWGDPGLFANCTTSDCHKDIRDEKEHGLHVIGAHNRCGDCHDAHDSTAKTSEKRCKSCHKDYKKLCNKKINEAVDCEVW